MKQTAQPVDPQFAAGAQGSSLYNDDLAPTGVAQRTWRWYHFAALWVGMVMNIASYMLAAGLTEEGMSPWQAVATVLLGNLIVLVPMQLIGHAGAKHGIPYAVLVRSSFGTQGAKHLCAIHAKNLRIDLDRIHVPRGIHFRPNGGNNQTFDLAESSSVASRNFAAARTGLRKMFQLHLQHRALKAFHAIVVSDKFVLVSAGLAVGARGTSELRDAIVVGRERSAFAIGAEILRRIKTERRSVAQTPSAPAPITRTMGLAGIFEHAETMAGRDLEDRIHIGHTAVKMNGNDGLRLACDGTLDEFRVEIRRSRVNIHENGTRAAIRDGFGRGEKRIRRCDDFVAVLDPKRQQAKMKGARS